MITMSTESFLLFIGALIIFLFYLRKSQDKHVLVFVLGDIGRSPRMQYHALSLIENGYHVNFVGYEGSTPLAALERSPFVKFYYLRSPEKMPVGAGKFKYLLKAIQRVVLQTLDLIFILLIRVPGFQYILVQNPPSIPSLAILYIVRLLRNAKLIIDWHNFGYSVMALNLGRNHIFVKIAGRYERIFGNFGDAHLCVTQAMKGFLIEQWGFKAPITVLYDRPPEHFRKQAASEIHELLLRYPFGKDTRIDIPKQCVDSTLLTIQTSHIAAPRFYEQRPALLVSSTSWTEDEDFSVLLDALIEYDKLVQRNKLLPEVVLVITGKGPLKAYYEDKIKLLAFKHVQIHTAWLEIEDYPVLLGSADFGICLHTSSSGLDLPMKVVDMFGCGLPVTAINYECISELVKDDVNGKLFSNSLELAQHLATLLEGFPIEPKELNKLAKGVKSFQKERWLSNWNQNAKPLFS